MRRGVTSLLVVLTLLAAAASAASFTPTFIPGPNVVTYENLATLRYAATGWATQINVSSLALANALQLFTVANNNTVLFSTQPAIDNQGTLTFVLTENQCGVAGVTILICDNTAPAQCGTTTSVLITVTCVNQAPTFTMLFNPITVAQNSSAVTIPLWATNVLPGPANEVSTQLTGLTFFFTPDNSAFFVGSITAAISGNSASLTYQIAPGMSGTTTVRVALHDQGGTLYGGVDTTIQTLTFVITAVNQPPTFSLKFTTITVLENQYLSNVPYSLSSFALDISPGLNENLPTSSIQVAQTVSFTVAVDTPAMFSVQPAVDALGTLSFATALNAHGTVTVVIQAKDSFVPPAYSSRVTFTIVVTEIAVPPTFTILKDLRGSTITACTSTVAANCVRSVPNFLTNVVWSPTNPAAGASSTSAPPSISVTCDSNCLQLFQSAPTITTTAPYTLTLPLANGKSTTVGSPVTLTVTLDNKGPTASGGASTATGTFLLDVYLQPSPPSWSSTLTNSALSVLENSGAQQIAIGSSIQSSTASTVTTGLQFTAVAQNQALFSVQPTIAIVSGNAVLSFTPATYAFGQTFITVYLVNTLTAQNADPYTFVLTITNVNQAPTFTSGGDVTLNQDSGAHVFQWATSVSAGVNESSVQTVAFTVSCQNATLFSTQPTMLPSGVMSLVLASGMSGSCTCSVYCMDSATPPLQSTTATFALYVHHINQAPTFTPGPDLVMYEASVPNQTTVAKWAASPSVGPTNPSSLTLTFIATAQDPSWYTVLPRIDSVTGTLTFTLAAFVNGVTYITYALQNSGSNVAPDSNTSPTSTMQLVVLSVNQAPSFLAGPDIQVLQNSGSFRRASWASSMSAGPANEASQKLNFTLFPSDNTYFSIPPTVDVVSGDLTFVLASNVAGTTQVLVCLMDNGGTLRGGVETTCRTLTLAVTAVNQPPTAQPTVTQLEVLENAGQQNKVNFLTSVTTGPSATDGKQYIKAMSCSLPLAAQLLFSEQPHFTFSTVDPNVNTLTFTPATNAVGTVVVTYSIQDSGGTLNGGVDTLTQTFIIKLIAVNGAPTFTAGPAIAVKQNSGTYYALWATAIVVSPTITGLTAAFSVTVDQPSWFSVAPYVTSTGYLGFTLNPNVYGVVNLRVVLQNNGGTAYNGTDTSMPALTTLTITFVNTAPSFTMGPDLTVLENGSPFTYSAWATNIIAGPPMEDLAQHAGLKFILTPVTSSYFSVLPTIDAQTGDLTFTTATNKFGTTQVSVVLKDQGGVANGGSDTSAAKLITLQIVNVNQPPSATIQGDLVVLENAGDQVIKGWVTAVTAGPGEDSIQTTALSLTNDSPLLFSSPPRLVGKDLYFTPATNAYGTATLILNVTDNGGTANGGIDRSSVTARLTITAVNQQPYFTVGADITVQENSGTTSVAGWLTQASTGAANEVTQTLTASFTVDRTDILVSMPTLDFATGTLTFAVQQYASGTVTVSMTVKDNGGTANGGKDTSATQTFKIIVNFVNQPPSFVAGSPVIVASNAVSSYSIPWASNISAGPRETSQTVAFAVTNLKASLFTATGQPALDASGVLTFTVAAGATGNTTLAVSLRDSAGGVSDVSYIVIQVISVNINTNVILTLNAVYESFNTATFKQIIANDLGISTSQIVIISIAKGSVIVTFQIVGSSGTTSDALTQTFVGHAQDPTSTVYKSLSVLAVSTVASGTSSGSGVNTNGSSGDNSSVNYVALGIGLAAAVLVISLLAIGGVVFYRRRQEKKRQQRFRQAAAAGFATSSHPYDDNNIPPTSKSNPIHGTFTSPLKQNANGTGASPQRQNSPGKGADEPYGDHYGDVYVGQQVDPFDGRPIRERELDRSPGRRKPNSAYVPVMTPPARIYAQPSPRMSRWPAARDQGNY